MSDDSKILKQEITEAADRCLEEIKAVGRVVATFVGMANALAKDKALITPKEFEERYSRGERIHTILHSLMKGHPFTAPIVQTVNEMLLCRLVDNFLIYLSNVISLIYLAEPDRLRSAKINITADDLFFATDMKILRNLVIERHVRDLAYRGLESLNKYLAQRDQLDFQLFPNKEDRKFFSDMVEIRNLIVHNRGVINATFLERVNYLEGQAIGEQPEIPGAMLDDTVELTCRLVFNIDQRVIAKFRLATAKTFEMTVKKPVVTR